MVEFRFNMEKERWEAYVDGELKAYTTDNTKEAFQEMKHLFEQKQYEVKIGETINDTDNFNKLT